LLEEEQMRTNKEEPHQFAAAYRPGSRLDSRRAGCGCFGCFGSLLASVIVSAIAYVLFVPFRFRLGDRWTPLGRWEAVGKLRDSAGFDYGLYTQFGPNVSIDYRTGPGTFVSPCCNLLGKAQVCRPGARGIVSTWTAGFPVLGCTPTPARWR
jgi:hypothetical protein